MELVAHYLELIKPKKRKGLWELPTPGVHLRDIIKANNGWTLTDGEIEANLNVLEFSYENEAIPMYYVGSSSPVSYHSSPNVEISIRILADTREAYELCRRIGATVTLERSMGDMTMTYTGVIMDTYSSESEQEIILTLVATRSGRR